MRAIGRSKNMQHSLKPLDQITPSTILVQITKVLCVLLSLMLLATTALAVTGNFSWDNRGGYGIYDSALEGLDSYYNPLWEVLIATQIIALIVLPFVLFALRRRLRVAVSPWIFVAVLTLIGTLSWLYFPPTYDRFDPLTESWLAEVVRAEFMIFGSIVLSYAVYFMFRKRFNKLSDHAQVAIVLVASITLAIFGLWYHHSQKIDCFSYKTEKGGPTLYYQCQ